MLPRACLATVTARTFEQLKCNDAEKRAFDVVVDLLERFLQETGRLAAQYRDLGSRQTGALPDAARALADLGVPLESLLGPTLVKHSGLERLPRFPAEGLLELPPSLVTEDDLPAVPFPQEAPSWLPPLPPRHAYMHTTAPAVAALSAVAQVAVKDERRHQVEGYLERALKRPRSGEEGAEEAAAEEGAEEAGARAQRARPAPVDIDQAWADAHAARQVRGARMQVETGEAEEDENEYQLRLKAEAIVARRPE